MHVAEDNIIYAICDCPSENQPSSHFQFYHSDYNFLLRKNYLVTICNING